MNDKRYDAIVIGSGAGGSAAAYRLARKGWKVLLLEKGQALPMDGSTLDVDKVIRQGRFRSTEPWLDKDGRTFVPEEYFNLGGKTKWYGAALLRFDPHEFAADEAHQCLSWPIDYDELAPYYDEAEELLGVRPFAPESDLRTIVARLTGNGAGWTAGPLPLALAPDILAHPEEASRFDAFASVKGLKGDGQRLLERLRYASGLEILTGQAASRLVADGTPERVAGVITRDGRLFRADRVLLAAGALHSPRLLQGYLEDSGLGNRLPCAPMVGRHYKHHLLSALVGFSLSRKTDLLRKTVLLLNARFPHSSIQPLGFDGELIGTLVPGVVPRRLAGLLGQRAYGFFLQTEDGSHADNRVVADGERPQLNYDSSRLAPARTEHRRLVYAFQRALPGTGLLGFAKPISLGGTAHACGTSPGPGRARGGNGWSDGRCSPLARMPHAKAQRRKILNILSVLESA